MTEKRKRDGVRSAQSSTKVLQRMLSAAAVLFVLCLVFMAPASAEPTGTGTVTDPYLVTNIEELTEAFTSGGYVKLSDSFDVSDASVSVSETNPVVLDLNGQTITVIESATGSWAFINLGPGSEFTLKDEAGNGQITLTATQNRGWASYSSVISVQRATATINGGTIQHLGGTDMAYGIDVLTNTGSENAKLIVNGGSIDSTYRAVRLFLNSEKATCSLEVTGGSISGTNNAGVWIQNANDNANPYSATITGGSISGGKNGAIMVSGDSATSLPGTLTINGGTLTSSSPEGTVKLSGMNNVESGFTLNIGSAAVIENTGEGTAIFGAAKNALSGTGTADDPYIIDSKTALQMFRDSVNAGNTYAGKTVTLTTDIDLNNEEWTPIGTSGKGVSSSSSYIFKGNFDGGYHKISNLRIASGTSGAYGTVNYLNAAESYYQCGLFGKVAGASISNLTIENVKIQNGMVTNTRGAQGTGTLIGEAVNSEISNILITGKIEIDAMYKVGGIIGSVYYSGDTTITNASIIGNDASYIKATDEAYGNCCNLGGIVGFSEMGESDTLSLINCISDIDIIGGWQFGGLIGASSNSGLRVSNSEVKGTLSADDENAVIGGLVGIGAANSKINFVESSFTGAFGKSADGVKVDYFYGKDHGTSSSSQEMTSTGCFVALNPESVLTPENKAGITYLLTGDSDGTILIGNIAELKAVCDAVNADGKVQNGAGTEVPAKGASYKLTADIDLQNQPWTPIGLNADGSAKFAGTFDGNDKTIYNLNVTGREPSYTSAGLFGATTGTIKNLTIDGAYVEHVSSGSATVNGIAVLAGSTAYGATIENITVKNAVVKGNRYVAGIVGYADGTIRNCHVENVTLIATPDKLTGSYNNGDKVGGIIGLTNSGIAEISGCSANDVDITAYRDAGGIVGALTGNDIVISDNSVSNIDITIDQFTNSYGSKPTNAGAVAGRLLINDGETSNPNEEEVETKNVVTAVKVTTIDTTGEITVDLGFSYEIDTVYLTGDSTSGYSVLENSVIHLPLNYSVTAESSPADVWYVNVTVTDENEAPVQVAHSLSSSVIDASYFQYHEKNKVYQVSNNGLVGVDEDTPALFELDLETVALATDKKYNVTIEITTVATTDIVGDASLYSYDAVSELEIQIGIDAWVISDDHNLYNTTEEGNAVAKPWGLDHRAHIVYEVKNPYNGKDTTYFSNEDNTIVKRNADAPYGLNLSGSVNKTIVKIVGGKEKAVVAGTKITAENGKLVMTVADADLDADSFKITFDGQKAGDLSNIKAFPDTIDVIDANYILKELAATGNYIPADFKVFADVTKDAKIDTDDATLVFFFGLNKLADEQKTSVELEYPTA